jgi:hypothetical protein
MCAWEVSIHALVDCQKEHSGFERWRVGVHFFYVLILRSSSPTALPMVSLTNPLRNFKRTDLSLSRFMAVSRGILIYKC